jgi:hypothetical protein
MSCRRPKPRGVSPAACPRWRPSLTFAGASRVDSVRDRTERKGSAVGHCRAERASGVWGGRARRSHHDNSQVAERVPSGVVVARRSGRGRPPGRRAKGFGRNHHCSPHQVERCGAPISVALGRSAEDCRTAGAAVPDWWMGATLSSSAIRLLARLRNRAALTTG